MPLYEKLGKMKILVIDDDRYLLDSMFVYFDYKGIPMKGFDNVSEAMAALSGESFDLIICDYLMPGMDGIAFLKLAGDLQPGAFRILITAYPRPEILSPENRKAYNELIQKPLTIGKLEATLGKLLGMERTNGSVA